MRAIPLVLALIATPALADVAGIASVIDGDTIEVHGQRIRLHCSALAPTCGQSKSFWAHFPVHDAEIHGC